MRFIGVGVKMAYTEKEIELYEVLAKINSANNDIIRVFENNIGELLKIENSNKWMDEFTEKIFVINDILKKTKIPKKFLILNKLEEKK